MRDRLPEELEGAARSPSPEIGLEHVSNVSQEFQPGERAADSLALTAPTTVVRTDAECPVPPVPSSLATVGSWPSLPGYAILDILGRGGMGVVYKALQVGLNRLVALKMIVSGAHAGTEELARFRREAEAVAGLRHPNIVQIYEIGELDGVPFFSLELADGGSLADRLDGTPQPARAAAELVETLARAVHAAHECGIVHRDLKPANILLSVSSDRRAVSRKKPEGAGLDHNSLVTDDCIPKITDFGLAKRLDIEVGQTKTGAVIGTPSYMAPEQAAGRTREIGRATDVYALGAILYELLTGRPPFRAETALETARQVIYVEPVSPRRLQPKVPRDLETICLKCLAKEPRKRYARALALAEDLHRYLGGEPIQARPATSWERAIKWTKRRPALAALIAATCVAVLSLFAFSAEHLHQRARDAERELGRHLQLEKLRADVQDLLSQVREAIAARDWPEARLRQSEALAKIGTEPALADLKEQADHLGEKIRRHETMRATYYQFGKRHDDVLFYEAQTQLAVLDPASSREATEAAAREALRQFGVAVEAKYAPNIPAEYFSEREKAEITEGCYELLLILADLGAQTPPGKTSGDSRRAGRALEILNGAAGFGILTRAYHLRRARYLAQRGGDPAEVRRERERAAALQPASATDYFLLGNDSYKQGKMEQAGLEFEQALRAHPGHFWAQFYLATCHLKLKRWAEAKVVLTSCLKQRSDFAWIYLLRAIACGEIGLQARVAEKRLHGQGDEAQAERQSAAAAFHFHAAQDDFKEALRQNGDAEGTNRDAAIHYAICTSRSVLWFNLGKLDDAVADLQQAIALRPKDYQAYVNLAQTYQKQGESDQALKLFGKAIGLQPEAAALYRTRAQLHLERHDPDAALWDLEEAIRRETDRTSPALVEDHLQRSAILFRKKQYADSLTACEIALRIRPLHPAAHRQRAEVLMALDRYQDAIQSFDQYLKDGKPTAAVYRERGRAWSKLRDFARAVDDYTLALALEPDAETHASRGWACLFIEAPQLALRDFDAAIQLKPKNGGAYNGRGCARVQLGRYREAVQDADEALRLGPQTDRMHYNAARTYAQAVAKAQGERQQRIRETLQAEYQDRAVQLIREALRLQPVPERGAFWRNVIRTDPALLPIRGSAGFRKLDEEYAQEAK